MAASSEDELVNKKTAIVADPSSESGAMAARALARTCHTICASMRNLAANKDKPVKKMCWLASDESTAALEPANSHAACVTDAVVDIVAMLGGHRLSRVYLNLCQDGAETANGVADRLRAQLTKRICLGDLFSRRAQRASLTTQRKEENHALCKFQAARRRNVQGAEGRTRPSHHGHAGRLF
jgi:hypothetical protein